jgi:Tfp pilus assembly protein PilF
LWSEESAETYAVLAAAYLEAEDATQARAMAQRALALNPGLTSARDVLDRLDRN